MITECGCSVEEFNAALSQNYDGDTPLYLDIILGAAQYENFVLLMQEYKSKIN